MDEVGYGFTDPGRDGQTSGNEPLLSSRQPSLCTTLKSPFIFYALTFDWSAWNTLSDARGPKESIKLHDHLGNFRISFQTNHQDNLGPEGSLVSVIWIELVDDPKFHW